MAAKTHDNFLDKTSDRKKLSKVQYVDFCELRQDNGKVFVSKEIALGNSVRPKNVSPSANFMLNRHYINKSETKDHFKKP